MTSTILFNGIDLSQYIRPLWNLDEQIVPDFDDDAIPVGNSDGKLFRVRSVAPRTITIPYYMIDPTQKQREEFAGILNVDEPKQLVFFDRPDEYYLAIPEGGISVGKTGWNDKSELVFTCYDPFRHSLTTQTADNMPYKDVPVNMLADSGFESGQTPANYVWSDGKSTDRTFRVTGQVPLFPTPFGNYMLLIQNYSTDSSLIPKQYAYYPITPVLIKKGETWTYSYYYATAGSATGQASDYLLETDTTTPIYELSMAHDSRDNSGEPKAWHRFVKTWTADRDITVTCLRFGFIKTSASPGWVCIDNIKLAQEPTVSPWSPKPADSEYYADTITVDYQGTYPAYPILTATMKSENGLVAFANDSGGVLQFGSPEEVDTVTKVKSDKVIDDGMRPGQTGYTFNVGPITYANYVNNGAANTFDGSIKFIGETAEPQFVDDKIQHWHGPSMYRTVPTNSLGDNTGSFIWRTRFDYNTDAKGLGRLEINLTSGGKVIASFTMRDSNSNTTEQHTEYWVNGKLLKDISMNQKLFGNGFYELTVTRNQGKGNFKLSKVAKLNGDSVVPESTYQVPFVDSTFDTATIDGVTIWLMKFSDYKATSMDITDMKFHWINVHYIEDVPNRFDTGDVVTVDVASRKVYLNGVIDNTLQTVGNQWDTFKLDPGITTIQPVGSSWATQFDTQLTYREAWL